MKRSGIRTTSLVFAIAGCLAIVTDLEAGHRRHGRGNYGGGCGGASYGGYGYGGPVYGGYGYGGFGYPGAYATYPYGSVYRGYGYAPTWGGYGGGYSAPAYSSPAPLAGAAVDAAELPPAGTTNAAGNAADRSARADFGGDALPPGGITPLQTTDPGAGAPPGASGRSGTPNAPNPTPGTHPNPDAAGIPGTPDASLRAAPPVTPGTR